MSSSSITDCTSCHRDISRIMEHYKHQSMTFCTQDCRNQYIDVHKRFCVQCGTPIGTTYFTKYTHTFCSTKCRDEMYQPSTTSYSSLNKSSDDIWAPYRERWHQNQQRIIDERIAEKPKGRFDINMDVSPPIPPHTSHTSHTPHTSATLVAHEPSNIYENDYDYQQEDSEDQQEDYEDQVNNPLYSGLYKNISKSGDMREGGIDQVQCFNCKKPLTFIYQLYKDNLYCGDECINELEKMKSDLFSDAKKDELKLIKFNDDEFTEIVNLEEEENRLYRRNSDDEYVSDNEELDKQMALTSFSFKKEEPLKGRSSDPQTIYTVQCKYCYAKNTRYEPLKGDYFCSTTCYNEHRELSDLFKPISIDAHAPATTETKYYSYTRESDVNKGYFRCKQCEKCVITTSGYNFYHDNLFCGYECYDLYQAIEKIEHYDQVQSQKIDSVVQARMASKKE